MTGPEHYREAEQCLRAAETTDVESAYGRYLVAAAQVHATLAHAAAVGVGQDDMAWVAVAGGVEAAR